MDRALNAGAAGFELSDAERRLVAERISAVCARWTQRLEEAPAAAPGFDFAELQNLYDNLTFGVDAAGADRQVAAVEKIIARLAGALEQAGAEDFVPRELLPLYQEIVGLTDRFCRERLNDEYLELCRITAAALCQNGSPAVRGKPAGWASGVAAAVGWANFLTDPAQTPHLRSDEIAKWFGVSAATMNSKSKTIRDGLEMSPLDPRFTLPSRMADNPLVQMSNLLLGAGGDGVLRPAAARADSDEGTAFQLKITLRDVKPAVWRRVQTLDCPLDELHDVIQAAVGWHNCHLHEFRVGDTRILSTAMDEFEAAPDDARMETEVWLSDLYDAGVKKIDYLYDFGDGWEHVIAIEKELSEEAVEDDPICTAGAGACPPEDVGGPWGYAGFLEAMADPTHARHGELKEWYGDEFDPKHFDAAEANRLLAGRVS